MSDAFFLSWSREELILVGSVFAIGLMVVAHRSTKNFPVELRALLNSKPSSGEKSNLSSRVKLVSE